MKRKFELFMGCLGNGITACNRAVMEHGDYKQGAHISPAGNIRLYVPESYIPAPDMERIKAAAEGSRLDFLRKIKNKAAANPNRAYLDLLGSLPTDEFLAYITDAGATRDAQDRKLIELALAYN